MTAAILHLVTDFGLQDPYVGILHSIVGALAPQVRVIDLMHHVPPQDVAAGAYWLGLLEPHLPLGAHVVAVVDPGVGSARRGIAIRTLGRTYVGPDNGLLGELFSETTEARVIDPHAHALSSSSTFDGRDIFVPIGARLASGALHFAHVGPAIACSELVRSPVPAASGSPVKRLGIVVAIDRFGNLLTNISGADLSQLEPASIYVGKRALKLSKSYSDVEPFEYVALLNAWDRLEIARRDGSAAEGLGMTAGTTVVIQRNSR